MTAALAPWQERVVAEEAELRTKHEALLLYISGDAFKTLSAKTKTLMRRQAQAMQVYAEVLRERIADFTRHPDDEMVAFWIQRASDRDPLAQRQVRAAVEADRLHLLPIKPLDSHMRQEFTTCLRKELEQLFGEVVLL